MTNVIVRTIDNRTRPNTRRGEAPAARDRVRAPVEPRDQTGNPCGAAANGAAHGLRGPHYPDDGVCRMTTAISVAVSEFRPPKAMPGEVAAVLCEWWWPTLS
jgi:hypothetical protein